MLSNFVKTTARNLAKNKVISFINIFGLAIGMAGVILIFLWIKNEISYDQFHADSGSLYKIYNRTASGNGPIDVWPAIAPPVGPDLKREFPDVITATRVDGPNERIVNYKEKSVVVNETGVDKSFLTMFSFPLLKGNPKHALDEANGMILTEGMAKSIFGPEDPMGKIVKLNNKDVYTVTGIMENLPRNTEFKFDCLVPIAGFEKTDAAAWRDHQFETYVQLKEGTSLAMFNNKIKDIIIKHAPDARIELFLQPSAQWHLYSRFENGNAAGGLIDTVKILFWIACLILIIACINFTNLATAQSTTRGREVGVRKVLGATKRSLVVRFLLESVMIALIAGVVAIILVQLCLPSFNNLVGKSLSLSFTNLLFWLSAIAFVLVTGLLAGSYPAFFLSSFKPVKVLKGIFKNKTESINPRMILVVTQFSAAIVLIVSTLIIYQQLHLIQNRDSGYVRKNLVESRINGDIGKNYQLIKNELIASGAVTSVCMTGLPITIENGNETGFQWGNSTPGQQNVQFSLFATDGNFIKTMGLKLVEGRDIDLAAYHTDSAAILMNETAVKITGLKNPVSRTIKNGSSTYTVVGVIKDFINGSPGQLTAPMIVLGSRYWHNNIAFRLNSKNSVANELKIAGEIFKKYNPAYPFQYKFADNEYDHKFKDDIRAGNLAGLFAGLIILISCLGLFGLAAYMAESRVKEMAVRKVMGAGISNLILLFSKDFLKLIVISILIATPTGWWAMSKWLQNYSYHVKLSLLYFVVAGIIAILVALLTISFHAIRSAFLNPVKSLKSE